MQCAHTTSNMYRSWWYRLSDVTSKNIYKIKTKSNENKKHTHTRTAASKKRNTEMFFKQSSKAQSLIRIIRHLAFISAVIGIFSVLFSLNMSINIWFQCYVCGLSARICMCSTANRSKSMYTEMKLKHLRNG